MRCSRLCAPCAQSVDVGMCLPSCSLRSSTRLRPGYLITERRSLKNSFEIRCSAFRVSDSEGKAISRRHILGSLIAGSGLLWGNLASRAEESGSSVPAGNQDTDDPSSSQIAPKSQQGEITTSPAQPTESTKSFKLTDEQIKALLAEEEEKRKQRRKTSKGRIRELEEARAEIAENQLILMSKEQELLNKDQTLAVLQEELELERKLRALLTKEKEKAEEEAALSMGLCTGGALLP